MHDIVEAMKKGILAGYLHLPVSSNVEPDLHDPSKAYFEKQSQLIEYF
jgi:hypothetical protein